MVKHFTISTLGCLFMVSYGMAAGNHKITREEFQHQKGAHLESTLSINGKTLKMQGNKTIKEMRLPAKMTERTPVIEFAPGTEQAYSKDCAGLMDSFFFGLVEYAETFPSTIVWNEDEVYFKDIISNYPCDTYVKGYLEENTITVDLPQTIDFYENLYEDGGGYGVNVVGMKLSTFIDEEDGEEYFTYEPDYSITSVTYTLDEDGNVVLNLPNNNVEEGEFPQFTLGLIYTDDDPEYDGQWVGFCDFSQIYNEFGAVSATMPEGIEPETYCVVLGDYGYPAFLAIDGDKVYIQDMISAMPKSVIVGDMTPDDSAEGIYNVSIAQNQYLGVFQDAFVMYTKVFYDNPDYDPFDWDSSPYILAPDEITYNLVYDSEAKTFTATDPDIYLGVNGYLDRVRYLDALKNISLVYQTDFAGTPMNPDKLEYTDEYLDMNGYVSFFFNIPALAQDGKLLDFESVFYSIFIDNELMTFEEKEGVDLLGDDCFMYNGLMEPTSLIPLDFDNGWDIYKYNPTSLEIGLYTEDFQTLGVQTIYFYNGETTKSDIVTLDVTTGDITTGVDKTISSADVLNIEYYNINGQRVNNPSKGIFMMKANLSDGKSIVKKIVRK